MSRAAKVTLAASIVATTFTVWLVHYQQELEHEVRTSYYFLYILILIFYSSHTSCSGPPLLPTYSYPAACEQTMYKGVLRDDERRKEKMRQRQLEFEESQKKRAIYEQVQKVEVEGSLADGGR